MSIIALEAGWSVRAVGGLEHLPKAHAALRRWLPVQVPGTVQGALIGQGLIPDPYQGRNELDLLWLDRLDWELECRIEAGVVDCARARQELVFEGIDTAAVVSLNGQVVGRSQNMFRRVVCDVRGILHPGANTLTVRIASPLAFCEAEAKRHGDERLPHDFRWQTGEVRRAHRRWMRKTGCHFGWDWGVFMAVSGIWQPARLECSDAPRIADVTVVQHHGAKAGTVDLDITVHLAHAVAIAGEVVVRIDGQELRLPAKGTVVSGRIRIAKPRLWWPNGAGRQELYDLAVSWGEAAPLCRRIGLRTIELITEADRNPEGKPAESFRFRVNGQDIYIKGANWIPADQLVERCTVPVYRHLLQSMVETHQNMVRVWGGGWYEQDAFYDLCDELGLLVWQDMMMACQLHPDAADFLTEMDAEVRGQVRRLQHRASIALWCGDNENNSGAAHWWKHQLPEGEAMAIYRRLMAAVGDAVQAEDRSRRFWASSPCNGVIDEDPDNPDRGDVHFWKVWHGGQPFAHYRTVRPRFASEFGFQSFPEPRTLWAYVPEGGRNPTSLEMEHHQRSDRGNQLITNTIARELPIWKDLDSYLWMSQANQAEAIRIAVEHWRRNQPWTMGTIYWQVNDLWPVASWSSIDWLGRWKALHHAAARFYAPLLVSLLAEGDKLQVWVTSDHPRALPLKGALELFSTTGRRLRRLPLRCALPAQGSRMVAEFAVADLVPKGVAPHQVACYASLSGGGAAGVGSGALRPWKWVELHDPRIRSRLVADRQGIVLELTAKTVAPFVHAEIQGTESHFVGDWDLLKPGETRRLRLVEHRDRGQKPIPLALARRRLRVQSLYDWSLRA